VEQLREVAASSFFTSAEPEFWEQGPDQEPRVVGTAVAVAAVAMLLAGLARYAWAMYRGYGVAEAGGLVLVSMLLWIGYLSLPSTQQHRALLRMHARLARFVDRRVDPLQSRTRDRLELRRERDRYRSIQDERSRRIAELGELAYRKFRTGALDPELQPHAQRVMGIEQQLLMQDQRLDQLHSPPKE